LARVETGTPEPTKMTTGEWLDRWLQSLPGKLRGGTLANYELTVRRHLVPTIGAVPLRRLTLADVEAAYARLAKSGSARGGGLSTKSVHNVHQVLHRALADAVRNDLLHRNVASGAHSLPSGRAEMKTWSVEQVRQFLGATASDPLFALWRLAALTGARRGELIGLRWSDIDLDGGFVSIQVQLSRQGLQGVTLGAPKTARGRRRVPIDGGTVAALREHRRAQVIKPIGDLVFTRADGSALDPDGVTDLFLAASRAAGLPRIRLHDLRHTAATLMLRAGVHPKTVSERLGHATVSMTLDLYSHSVPAMDVEASDRLAALVDGAS